MTTPLPNTSEVFHAVEALEPATVMDVLDALGQPWERRGTVRNRLEDLVAAGELIVDEGRPMRFAVNQLVGAGGAS